MAIKIDNRNNIFSLHTDNSTYQFQVDPHGFLLHLYYGKKTKGNADYLLNRQDRGFSLNPGCVLNDRTFSMDVLPQELPAWGSGDFRSPALVIEKADGTRDADFRYVSHEVRKGKYALKGLPAAYVEDADKAEAETLEVVLEDSALGMELHLLYGVLPHTDCITRAVFLKNRGSEVLYIDKLLPASLDFISGDYDLLTFYGRHCMERQPQRFPVTHYAQKIGSRRGTSSHQYNPFVIVAGKDTTDSAGSCCAMQFVYSGGFQAEAEKDQFGLTRVQIGLQEEGFHYPVRPGEVFTSPEVILSFSANGLDRLSHNLHGLIRHHICRGPWKYAPRPVVINSWEGLACGISKESLLSLAREAKPLGIDMLVVDDGWFGKRNDDNSSLGDWFADEEKLGGTLGELVEEVNRIGLEFGIWMEPEMISEDSRLYREHPDWALCAPGRDPVRGRNQLVLDFSRADVRENIYGQICAVLDCGNVSYLKWDYNRSICEVYSAAAEQQGTVLYDYMLGLYEVLERLHQRYPHILIEGCSGGGGRFDAGMLYYTPQIWTSDNTDAIDRTQIQYGTSFGYPASCMAAHVSVSPNQQTGRRTPFSTRGITAMYGGFGYELELAELTEEEKQEAKEQIRKYHCYEKLISEGLYYRLSNPLEDTAAGWEFVKEDGTEALVSAVLLKKQANDAVYYLKLKGLSEGKTYMETATGERYDADLLMSAGMPVLTGIGEYRACQFHFVEE